MRGRRGWEVVWSHPGIWSLQQLHWLDGARVDAAVQLFAATGEGVLGEVRGDPTGGRLHVRPFVVRLSLDRETRTITVWWVKQL